MKINKQQNPRTVIAIIIICMLTAIYGVVAFFNHYPPFPANAENTSTSSQKINMERTNTEKKQTQVLKDNPDQKTQNSQNDTPTTPKETTNAGKYSVNVLLTNAGIVNGNAKASGMVTNLVEAGGTCMYTFTSGNSTIIKTSQSLTNPTSTTCETVTFPASELPVSGNWKVILAYSSGTASGISNEKDFTK